MISLAVLASGALPAMGDDDSKRADYLVDHVRRAPGPEEAMAAYMQARVHLGDDHKRLNDAYVRAMVGFGQPEVLRLVAARLVDDDKDNALGNAVLAWHLAREQRMAEAFKHMERAAKKDDDHPFIQDLGGQLMAWYDVTRKFENLPEKIDDAAEEVKDELEDKRVFKESYAAARAELLGQRAVVPPPVAVPPPTYRVEPVPQPRYVPVPQPQYVPVPVPAPRYVPVPVPAPRYVPVPPPGYHRDSGGIRFFFSWGGRSHDRFDDDDYRRRSKHDDDRKFKSRDGKWEFDDGKWKFDD